MERPEFIQDVESQRLYFRATEGRPSATPTVGTKDNTGTELCEAADTNVTLDSVNTTIANSAAAGAKSVVVTAATGITVGKWYRLTNKYGEAEDVQVEKINSTTIYLKTPLVTAFDLLSTTYGTFQSCEFYYTLQEADYDTLRELVQATAVYTVGGLTYHQRLSFDVVLQPLTNILTADAVYKRFGLDLARGEPDDTRGEDYANQREEAWKIVKARIRQHSDAEDQWRPAMVVDGANLWLWACAVFARVCHEQGVKVIRTEPPPTRDELLADEEAERQRALDSISWLEKTEDEGMDEDEERPVEPDLYR